MINLIQKLFIFIFILPLISCSKSSENIISIDENTYIEKFELVQNNANNNTTVKISSPKAIIDQTTKDIDIYDSDIKLSDKTGNTINISSGRSTLNNSINVIKAYNNVNIKLPDDENAYILTNSVEWFLDKSVMDFDSPLAINFKDTIITSLNGSYDIESSILTLKNNIFNRNIYNSEGIIDYQIEIYSDNAKWTESDNSIVFTSDNKQVETIFKILSIKNVK